MQSMSSIIYDFSLSFWLPSLLTWVLLPHFTLLILPPLYIEKELMADPNPQVLAE